MACIHRSDTSSVGSTLPVLTEPPVICRNHEPNHNKQDTNEEHDISESAQLTAILHPVLAQLASIKAIRDLETDSNPDDKIKIAISSRGLILLHHLLDLDAPFSPSGELSSPESSAVRRLSAEHAPA
jgi:hypothetical protein